jgi:hypothetical protein
MIENLMQTILNISRSLTENSSSLIPTLTKLYKDILKYVCDKANGLNVDKPALNNIYLEIFKKLVNNNSIASIPTNNWLSWIMDKINEV